MENPISNWDIYSLVSKYYPTKIIRYDQLLDMTIEDLLPTYDNILVILYLTKKSFGHWTCLFYNSDGLNFFDSYGLKPDDELKWKINSKFRKLHYEEYPLLTIMISSYMKKNNISSITYNEYQYQVYDNITATCGKHVINRCINKYLTNEKYYKYILYNTIYLTPDEYVAKKYDEYVHDG